MQVVMKKLEDGVKSFLNDYLYFYCCVSITFLGVDLKKKKQTTTLSGIKPNLLKNKKNDNLILTQKQFYFKYILTVMFFKIVKDA